MLKYHKHGFYFPELILWKKDVKFTQWQDRGSTDVYTLDWSYKDKKIQDGHYQWLAQHWPTKNIPVHNTLPQRWEEWLSNIKYAIPSHYYTEISNQTHQAIEEWNGKYPFDTVIRDICLQSAIAHVAVAFKLLADCAYDPATNYFSRGDDKVILGPALMYRFWVGQTGGGLLQSHSEFDHLKWLLDCNVKLWSKEARTTMRKTIKDFITDIEVFEKEWDIQHSKIYEDLPKFGGQPTTEPEAYKAEESVTTTLAELGPPRGVTHEKKHKKVTAATIPVPEIGPASFTSNPA